MMLRKVLFFVCSLFLGITTNAQVGELVAAGSTPNLYLNYEAQPKDNFYGVGRLFNVHPKELALYNGLKIENGLNIGQHIKIPLKDSNFTQTGKKNQGEVLVPVNHIVQEKEGLYRIGLNHNNISQEMLKIFNNLTGEGIQVGSLLVIGYLKVKPEESSLASSARGMQPEVVKESKPLVEVNEKKEAPKQNEIITKTREEPKVIMNPVVTPIENKNTPATGIVPEPGNYEDEPKEVIKVNALPGFFKDLFSEQNRGKSMSTADMTCSIFKSSSGWEDSRYYALMNNVPSGTVVKVTYTVNNKSIYAKVLGEVPDLRQNQGISIRISNAAAAALEAVENAFEIVVTFPGQ